MLGFSLFKRWNWFVWGAGGAHSWVVNREYCYRLMQDSLRFWPLKRIWDLTSCFHQTQRAWEFLHSSCSEIWKWLRRLVFCWYHSVVITGNIQCDVCAVLDLYCVFLSLTGFRGWATFGGYSLAMIWKHWQNWYHTLMWMWLSWAGSFHVTCPGPWLVSVSPSAWWFTVRCGLVGKQLMVA